MSDHNDVVAEYFNSTGAPAGHGFADAPQDPQFGGTAGYYSFPIAERIVGISMDTIQWSGGPSGSISDPQFQWLEEQLAANTVISYGPQGELINNPDAENNLIVLFSHHTSKTLTNPGDDDAGAPYHCFKPSDSAECADDGLKELLQRYPNVIAWVNGHEHNNRVTAQKAPKGQAPDRGFWEINTSAHIDWPQQARLIEVAFQAGTGEQPDVVILYGTLVDSAAPVKPDPAMDNISYLASLSRYQSYKDACLRKGQADCSSTGTGKDRNVKLIEIAPFDPTL